MGCGHADLSSPAGDDDAEDPDCDPGEHGTCLDGRRALRHQRADGLEMAQARQRPLPEPHAAPAADGADAGPRQAVAVALRKALLLPLDDLLPVVRELPRTRTFRARGSTDACAGTGPALCAI